MLVFSRAPQSNYPLVEPLLVNLRLLSVIAQRRHSCTAAQLAAHPFHLVSFQSLTPCTRRRDRLCLDAVMRMTSAPSGVDAFSPISQLLGEVLACRVMQVRFSSVGNMFGGDLLLNLGRLVVITIIFFSDFIIFICRCRCCNC
jgi:hypothetical protein